MPGGIPLATCTLPIGVSYLLTYLLLHLGPALAPCARACSRRSDLATFTHPFPGRRRKSRSRAPGPSHSSVYEGRAPLLRSMSDAALDRAFCLVHSGRIGSSSRRGSTRVLVILRRAAFVRVPRARDSRLPRVASHNPRLPLDRSSRCCTARPPPGRPGPACSPPTADTAHPGYAPRTMLPVRLGAGARARVLAHEDSPHTPSSTDPPCRQSEAKAVDDTGRVPSMRVSHTSDYH